MPGPNSYGERIQWPDVLMRRTLLKRHRTPYRMRVATKCPSCGNTEVVFTIDKKDDFYECFVCGWKSKELPQVANHAP